MRRVSTVATLTMVMEEVASPRPGPGEVLLGVAAVGLCGGDYHIFNGSGPYTKFPHVQGHEFSGVVTELGPGVTGLKVGDLVAVEPLVSCGRCFACRRGRRNCCRELRVIGAHVNGALAEQVVVPATAAFAVSGLDGELAALVEPTSIGLQAVQRSAVAAGDRAVVLGAGPIGLAATLIAAERGASVLTVDRLGSRLATATAMGAERVIDTGSADLVAAVDDFTDGEGPAVIIDATGSPDLIRSAVDLIAPSGTVVVVGISAGELRLPVLDLTRKELNLLGSRNNAGLFAEAVRLVGRHPEQIRRWITQRTTLDGVAEQLAVAVARPDQVQKIIVTIDGGTR